MENIVDTTKQAAIRQRLIEVLTKAVEEDQRNVGLRNVKELTELIPEYTKDEIIDATKWLIQDNRVELGGVANKRVRVKR